MAKTMVKRERVKIAYNKVADEMAKKGIIVQEMADLLKTNPAHVCKIMKNNRPCISLPLAMMIAVILEKPVEKLFFLQHKKS